MFDAVPPALHDDASPLHVVIATRARAVTSFGTLRGRDGPPPIDFVIVGFGSDAVGCTADA